MSPNPYTDVLSAISSLRLQGFFFDFRSKPTGLYCPQDHQTYATETMRVHEYHFFDDVARPDMLHVVVALETPSGQRGIYKGIAEMGSDPLARDLLEC